MTEAEWRGLGVQQSQGWIHYMIHQPGKLFSTCSNFHFILMIYLHKLFLFVLLVLLINVWSEPHILLFRRPITSPPPGEENESWASYEQVSLYEIMQKCQAIAIVLLIIISSVTFFLIVCPYTLGSRNQHSPRRMNDSSSSTLLFFLAVLRRFSGTCPSFFQFCFLVPSRTKLYIKCVPRKETNN